MSERYVFTSESVGAGHPDKVCDQVSDAVLDACLAQDPKSRVACECLCTTGIIMIAGEITTKATLDFQTIARNTIRDIGYTDPDIGFDYKNSSVVVSVHQQSPDISQGVTEGQGLFKEQGAGDQGMMFGYACRETPHLMPLPIYLAHRLVEEQARLMRGKYKYLRPDCKSQVSVEYVDGKPIRVTNVVLSTQHTEAVSLATLRKDLIPNLIKKIVPAKLLTKETEYYVNPTGRFVVGGPHGDTGLTGRKIIVDTYGGMGRHGGGAFSGKDPSKVDRSAAYATRWVAKNLVAAGVADRVELQVAYAIGVAKPLSLLVNTFGTAKNGLTEEQLVECVENVFDLRPAGIIKGLDLLRPIYGPTASFGHFGRSQFPWEQTNKVAAIKKFLKLK